MPGDDSKRQPNRLGPRNGKADDRASRDALKSKLLRFPENLLDELDDGIRQHNWGAMKCLAHLKLRYEGPLVFPGKDTFEKYVSNRKTYFRLKAERHLAAEAALADLPPVPNLNNLPASDRQAWLEGVQRNLGARVERVKEIQESEEDARYERILVDALLAIPEVIEKQDARDQKMGIDRARVQSVVHVLLQHISKAVTQAYKDVHGEEKFEAFLKALERRLDGLSYPLIEAEVLAVVTEAKRITAGEEKGHD